MAGGLVVACCLLLMFTTAGGSWFNICELHIGRISIESDWNCQDCAIPGLPASF
jgi:hypothetical protein